MCLPATLKYDACCLIHAKTSPRSHLRVGYGPASERMVNGLVLMSLFYTNGALKAPFYYKPHSPDHTHSYKCVFFYTSEHYLTFVPTLMGGRMGSNSGFSMLPKDALICRLE